MSLQDIQDIYFDNGFRLILQEDKKVPIFSVYHTVKTGSIHEEKNLGCGLSHFLEHMMFKPSTNYSEKPISEIIEATGGHVNAYTSLDHTCYYFRTGSEYLEKVFAPFIDTILYPLFPESEFINEKDIILRERAMTLDNPSRILSEKVLNLLFKNHPLGIPVIGYTDNIKKVSREIMLEYFHKRYTPANSFMVVTGNFDASFIVKMVEETVGQIPRTNNETVILPPVEMQASEMRKTVFFPDSMARLSVSFRIPPCQHQDIPVLDTLCDILGNTQSSRLPQKLKNIEKKAIDIGSHTYTPRYDGLFEVIARCKPKNIDLLEKRILEEMELLTIEKIDPKELNRSVLQTEISFIESYQTILGSAGMISSSVLNYDMLDYWDFYLEQIKKLTPEDILNTARKYFSRNNYNIVRQLPENIQSITTPENTESSRKTNEEKEADTIETISGGVRLITVSRTDLPLVNIALVLPGGSLRDEKGYTGTSYLLSKLFETETEHYKEQQFSEFLDDHGIELDSFSGNNTLGIQLGCLSEKLPEALKVMEEILIHSEFSEDIFLREKENLVDSLESRFTQVIPKAMLSMLENLYGDHPYSSIKTGTVNTVSKITLEKIKEFYSSILQKNKTIISVAGDFDKEILTKGIKNICKAIKWSKKKEIEIPLPDFPTKQKTIRSHLKREQTAIIMGIFGSTITSPDYDAIKIVYAVLNGLSSRIFDSIREKNGLSYNTGATNSVGEHPGYFALYALIHAEGVEQVIGLLDNEWKKLAENGITKDEFSQAVIKLKSELAVEMQKTESLAIKTALDEYYGLGYNTFINENKKYSSLDYKTVNATIKHYFRKKGRITVITGDLAT
ncbi:MAG: pitrilysin family protein [Verrucomicrobiota bacterium]|nr:pitrilysin family protein [Verrucomicrobiota bacterium]